MTIDCPELSMRIFINQKVTHGGRRGRTASERKVTKKKSS